MPINYILYLSDLKHLAEYAFREKSQINMVKKETDCFILLKVYLCHLSIKSWLRCDHGTLYWV